MKNLTPSLLSLLGALLAATAPAASVTLTNGDANGFSSFTSNGGATNWNSGAPPAAGNAYFTGAFLLRTPTNNSAVNAGDITFAGDSLQIDTGGTMSIKSTNRIVVNGLILNGGTVQEGGVTGNTPGGTPDIAVLAGSVNFTAASILKGAATGLLNIQSVITNDGTASPILSINTGPVQFSAANTFAGSITLASSSSTNILLRLGADNATPSTSLVTFNGATAFPVFLDLNGHNTVVSDLVFGNGTFFGYITNSAVGTTSTLSVGYGVASGSTKDMNGRGRIIDNPGVGGTIAVTKVGPGWFRFNDATNCNYHGNTTISEGLLKVGASNVLPWGTGKGNFSINGSGSLDLSGRDEVINGLSGNGFVDSSGAANTLSTLSVGSNDVTCTFDGVIQNTLNAASQGFVALAKVGAGALTLTGTNTFNGAVTVKSGSLWINNGGALGVGPKTNFVQNGTGAELHLNGTNGNISLDSSLSFITANPNGDGALVNEAGDNTISGTIDLAASGGGTLVSVKAGSLDLAGGISIVSGATPRELTLGGAANGTVDGVIADGPDGTNLLSLTKSGGGIWTLNNANSYSDVTTIGAGTLKLGASGSIADSSTINVQSGASFDVTSVSGGWVLGASGGKAMKGNGTVAGDVTINGKINPGDALLSQPIGALTFLNHLTLAGMAILELNRTNTPANADLLAANAVTFGGSLTVTNLGDELQAGDTFNLFDGAIDGAFSVTNLPALTGSLIWDISRLGSQGIIKVSLPVPSQPSITSVTRSGTNLNIQFSSEAGFNYYIQASPSLQPAAWAAISTNVGGGTITVPVPIDPAQPKQFFRVSSPNP